MRSFCQQIDKKWNMICLMKNKKVSEWLNKKFVEWRAKQTERKAGIAQFAEYLNLSRNTLNNYMNKGQEPEGENLKRIAQKLGSEIYEIVGKVPPNPFTQAIVAILNKLEESQQEEKAEVMLRSLDESEDDPEIQALIRDARQELEKHRKQKSGAENEKPTKKAK